MLGFAGYLPEALSALTKTEIALLMLSSGAVMLITRQWFLMMVGIIFLVWDLYQITNDIISYFHH
jgi:hypothetical protein